MLDGGAHFYDTYECSDGKFISIGSIEPQFYALLLEKAELTDELYTDQHNRDNWPELKTKIAKVFKTKTRAEWCAIMEYTDVCFAPVLDLEEGVTQHAPAPRFSRTPSSIPTRPPRAGEHTDDILGRWGFSDSEIAALKETGAV
jgi:alpha-methylacyl-CoA racemase